MVGRVYVTLTTEEIEIFHLSENSHPRNTVYFAASHIEGNYAATGSVYTDGSICMRSRSGYLSRNEWFYISTAFWVA